MSVYACLVCLSLSSSTLPLYTLPYKLAWDGSEKNGRPKLHTQGVTRVTGDAKNAFRKKLDGTILTYKALYYNKKLIDFPKICVV